jgi:hypothetical protein
MVRPSQPIVAETLKVPMLVASEARKDESTISPTTSGEKRKESMADPMAGAAKDKDYAPTSTVDAEGSKVPSPSHANLEV